MKGIRKLNCGKGQIVLLIFFCAIFCVSGCGKVGKIYPQNPDDFPSQYPKEVKR